MSKYSFKLNVHAIGCSCNGTLYNTSAD